MIVRTNSGEVVAELVRHNKKSILVKITNTKEVKKDGLTTLELSYRYIKRQLSDVVRY